jgi:hypothetical protein
MSLMANMDPSEQLIFDFLAYWQPNWMFDGKSGHTYYQDIGTLITMSETHLDGLIAQMRDTLTLIEDTCVSKWRWGWQDRTRIGETFSGFTTSPNILDSRRLLWICFDSADDAMLVRMIVNDLKKGEYVNGGRVSDSATGV